MSKQMQEDKSFELALEVFKRDNKNHEDLNKILQEIESWNMQYTKDSTSSSKELDKILSLKNLDYNDFFNHLPNDLQIGLYSDWLVEAKIDKPPFDIKNIERDFGAKILEHLKKINKLGNPNCKNFAFDYAVNFLKENGQDCYRLFSDLGRPPKFLANFFEKDINPPFAPEKYIYQIPDIVKILYKMDEDKCKKLLQDYPTALLSSSMEDKKIFETMLQKWYPDLYKNKQVIIMDYMKSFSEEPQIKESQFEEPLRKSVLDSFKAEALGKLVYVEYKDNSKGFLEAAIELKSVFPESRRIQEQFLLLKKENGVTEANISLFFDALIANQLSRPLNNFYKEQELCSLCKFYSKKRDVLEDKLIEEIFKHHKFDLKILQNPKMKDKIINGFKDYFEKSNLKDKLTNKGYLLNDELRLKDDEPLFKEDKNLLQSKFLLSLLKIQSANLYLFEEYQKSCLEDQDKIIKTFLDGLPFDQKEETELNLRREFSSKDKEKALLYLDGLIFIRARDITIGFQYKDSLGKSLDSLKKGEIEKFLSRNSSLGKEDSNRYAEMDEYRQANRFGRLLRGEYNKHTDFSRIFIELAKYVDKETLNKPEFKEKILDLVNGLKPDYRRLFYQETLRSGMANELKQILPAYLEESKKPKVRIPTLGEPPIIMIGSDFSQLGRFMAQKVFDKAAVIGDFGSGVKDLDELRIKIRERRDAKVPYLTFVLAAHGKDPKENKKDGLEEGKYYVQLGNYNSNVPIEDLCKIIKEESGDIPAIMHVESCFGENFKRYIKGNLPLGSCITTFSDETLPSMVYKDNVEKLGQSYDLLSKRPGTSIEEQAIIGRLIECNGDINTPKIHYVKKNGDIGLFDPDEKIMKMVDNLKDHKESIMQASKIIGFKKEKRDEIFKWIENRTDELKGKKIFDDKDGLKQELLREPKGEEIKDFKKNFFFSDEKTEYIFDNKVRRKKNTDFSDVGSHEIQGIGFLASAQDAPNIALILRTAAFLDEFEKGRNDPNHFLHIFSKGQEKQKNLMQKLDEIKVLANQKEQKKEMGRSKSAPQKQSSYFKN